MRLSPDCNCCGETEEPPCDCPDVFDCGIDALLGDPTLLEFEVSLYTLTNTNCCHGISEDFVGPLTLTYDRTECEFDPDGTVPACYYRFETEYFCLDAVTEYHAEVELRIARRCADPDTIDINLTYTVWEVGNPIDTAAHTGGTTVTGSVSGSTMPVTFPIIVVGTPGVPSCLPFPDGTEIEVALVP